MKSVHIRGIEAATLAALKRLARCHRRSLQGELHAILERAARTAPPGEEAGLDWITVKTGGPSPTWSRSEIYDDRGR